MIENGFAHRLRARPAVSLALLAAVTAASGCASIPRSLASPRVQVTGLSLLGAGLTGQRFRVELSVDNPNETPISVERLEFQIRLASEGYIDGQSGALDLPGSGTRRLAVEAFSEVVSSASRLMAVAQGPDDSLDYEITGELFLDSGLREPLAFFQRGQVPLSLTPDSQ